MSPPRRIPAAYAPGDFQTFPLATVESTSIWRRFEEICDRCWGRTAVVDGETVIDYRALRRMAETLAIGLAAAKPPGDAPVALVLGTEWRTAVAILGAIRAGIVFVPIDGSLPPVRIDDHTRACGASLVLTSVRHTASIAEGRGAAKLLVDDILDSPPGGGCPPPVSKEEVCRVLTSGTTGVPKQIVFTRKMILHDVAVRTNSLAISPSDSFAQLVGGTSLPLMTLFLALLNGASLHFNDVKQRGFAGLGGWIAASGISVLRLTPTLFRFVARNLESMNGLECLRLVSTGGERLNTDDVRLFQENFPSGSVLLNHLSSTECRVVCQYFIEHDTALTGSNVPVGYPLDDFEVVIVDDNGAPVSPGTPGEIMVRSAYLTPGYLDGSHGMVYLPRDPVSGVLVYQSGDLGVMHADGCVEHRGRKDRMAKIRGYRIELDEIEAVVRSIPSVEQVAAVVFEDDNGHASLAVFIAGASLRIGTRDVRHRVFETLGLFGMPQRVEQRKRLPVTGNGKIDRSVLERELAL